MSDPESTQVCKSPSLGWAEIQAERDAQLTKWGHQQDDGWSAGEWAALVGHYAARSVVNDLKTIDLAALRNDMVKVGALAMACIEAIDRKETSNV